MADADRQPGRNGHPLSWSIEIDANRRWLRTVIFARLGDAQAVEDVLQEVLLAAVAEKSPVHSPSGWLYRLAVRKSLLHRRKLGRERRRIDHVTRQVESPRDESKEPDPLDWLLADERRQLVRAALDQLNDRERELLLLKYTEEWSYKQMATHLDLSPAAVESRLHRARKHLREKLAALQISDL